MLEVDDTKKVNWARLTFDHLMESIKSTGPKEK
jgi:hypothetical protein